MGLFNSLQSLRHARIDLADKRGPSWFGDLFRVRALDIGDLAEGLAVTTVVLDKAAEASW